MFRVLARKATQICKSITVNPSVPIANRFSRALRGDMVTGYQWKFLNCYTTLPEDNSGLETIPERFDWRDFGVVSPVKDQGDHGTCFAHPVIASIEALYAIKTGEKLTLSVQELVDNVSDCDPQGGGNIMAALAFIRENGISLESDYGPYVGGKGCPKTEGRDMRRLVYIDGYETLPMGFESLVVERVLTQPLIASIDATLPFMYYEKGIYGLDVDPDYVDDDGEDDDNLAHTVEVIGFGSEGEGREYLIIKNSHGTEWGSDGYMKVWRNRRSRLGIGGIYRTVFYPILR